MIVSDSTCLIHLGRIGKLDILESAFGKVIIPEAVYREVVIKGKEVRAPEAKAIELSNWIIRKNLNHGLTEEAKELMKIANIGHGEAESIILAREEKIGLIIDDSVGVRVAQTFGIETYWTTSIILKLASEKSLKKQVAKGILEDLVKTGYRLKPEILVRLLEKFE